MDFSGYTFFELNKLYFMLGIEYIKRIWWILIILILLISVYKSNDIIK